MKKPAMDAGGDVRGHVAGTEDAGGAGQILKQAKLPIQQPLRHGSSRIDDQAEPEYGRYPPESRRSPPGDRRARARLSLGPAARARNPADRAPRPVPGANVNRQRRA